MSAETISTADLYQRVSKVPTLPASFTEFAGFTGKVTKKAALMRSGIYEVWIPLAVLRAVFNPLIHEHPEDTTFGAPDATVADAHKYRQDQDRKRYEESEKRYG